MMVDSSGCQNQKSQSNTKRSYMQDKPSDTALNETLQVQNIHMWKDCRTKEIEHIPSPMKFV